MKTKRKKSKRSFTRKKRGGAHGLVLNIMYDKNGNIIDIQSNELLATKDYEAVNKIDPKYSFRDVLWDTFRNVSENTEEFFHPFDAPKNRTPRKVKIAINDRRDIQLIKLTNMIIKILNKIDHYVAKPFIVIRRKGKQTDQNIEDFRHQYNLLLRDHEDKILEKFKQDENYRDVVRLMLKTPMLVNLMSIKFGLLRKGDMRLDEIREIFKKNNDNQLVDSLAKLTPINTEERENIEKIIRDEDIMKLKNENQDLREKVKNIENSNCIMNGSCPLRTDPLFEIQENVDGSTDEASLKEDESNAASQSEPQSSVQTPQAKRSTKQNASNASKEVIGKMEEFERLLASKFPEKVQIGGVDPSLDDYDLQQQAIESILKCLDIELRIVEPIKKYGEKTYQAIVLTMIQMILTPDMKDFPTFKNTFDSSYKGGSLCEGLKTAANSLSTLGRFRRSFSYDPIIQSFEKDCANFDLIIKKNFNELFAIIQSKTPTELSDMVKKANMTA